MSIAEQNRISRLIERVDALEARALAREDVRVGELEKMVNQLRGEIAAIKMRMGKKDG